MAIERFEKDLNIVQALVIPGLDTDLDVIQKLDDEPNDVGGLSPAELKAKFDEAGNLIKGYVNDTLLPAVSDTVAEHDQREAAERQRQAQEEDREAAESGRVSAEEARVRAETLRAAAEEARVQAEEARGAAEGLRALAESGRAGSEEVRVQAETARVNAEAARVAAEELRARAEEARAAAEVARVSAETERAAAETARGAEEGRRVTAETARGSAETARAVAEEDRDAAEEARAAAETGRGLEEAARKTAEEGRVTAEEGRRSAEAGREEAEEARNLWDDYDPARAYTPGNKTAFNGSSYLCTAATTGHLPTDRAYWRLIAAKGADGQGAGDMTAAVYDPTGKARDVFAYADQSAQAKADVAEAAAKAGSRPSTWTPTAQEVGAVPIAGGTVKGPLLLGADTGYIANESQTSMLAMYDDLSALLSSSGEKKMYVRLGDISSVHIQEPGVLVSCNDSSYIAVLENLIAVRGAATFADQVSVLSPPTEDNHAANKEYVDRRAAELVSDLPIKKLMGTAEHPIDLDTLTQVGIYYVQGNILDNGETGMRNIESALQIGIPLYVYDYGDQAIQQTIFLPEGVIMYRSREDDVWSFQVVYLLSRTEDVTLTAERWRGSGPFTQTVDVRFLNANGNGSIGLAQSATAEQRAAARDAMLSVTGQEAWNLTVTADGKKPTVDLPCVVTMLGWIEEVI